MKRLLYAFVLSFCAALLPVACIEEQEPEEPESVSEGKSWVTFGFGDASFDKINITTRATLGNSAESRVSNLFVFLFDSEGKRVYGRFFDNSNWVNTSAELEASSVDSWLVEANASAEEATHGKVRIYAPNTVGGKLYILSNVNSDMVNISPDKLRFIETLDDLNKLTATLNQQITERNGAFPMTGYVEGIKIENDKIVTGSGNPVNVELTRMDAKIVVKVRVATGYKGSVVGADNIETTHDIKEFKPLSWQVVNLPRTSFVLPQAVDAEGDFFNSAEHKFETRESKTFEYEGSDGSAVTTTSDEHGFSFYMLENRHKAKEAIPATAANKYHLRDTRNKDENGVYINDPNSLWKYAPEEATYLIIKGEVIMNLDLSNEAKSQQLSADVVYYIHLGDFASSCDDYDVCRNTSYTYTITIKGVNEIQNEVVSKTQENETGATGHVYVAKESIFTFDAHYGRAVFAFDEAHITNLDKLSWYVKTPFGREGTPNNIEGIEVPSGLDYRWVHFMINKHDEKGYSHNHEKYDPETAMTILEFSDYIKKQKRLFLRDKENNRLDNPTSAFRPELDEAWEAKFPDKTELHTRYRIYVTIFVDEFYYASNPITGEVREDLWKDFVNQPNRMMHILCDADKSADEDSRTTGSVVTIRQHSIQTIYNTSKPELKTAWGCETLDETRDVLWFYSRKESYNKDGNWVNPGGNIPDNAGNRSKTNGLYNTAKLWGLNFSDPAMKLKWIDYVNFDLPYALPDDDEKKTLRYACLTRNRDENGDGEINAAEVKWYMASIDQLASLYIGDQGLSADAALYPYYKKEIKENVMDDKNAYTWRAHVVSSTAASGYNYPAVLWAEEGASTGPYHTTYKKSAGLTIRCVRNLGMDAADEAEAQAMIQDENRIPEQAVLVTGPGINGTAGEVTENSIYKFDMSNLNPLSIRYYSSRELEPNDEYSVEAKVHWGFETGPMTEKSYTYNELSTLVREGKSPCPEGYRIPNIREGSLMQLNCPGNWQPQGMYSHVSTYNSHGSLGTGLDGEAGPSWLFDTERTRLEDEGGSRDKVRCVRDVGQ